MIRYLFFLICLGLISCSQTEAQKEASAIDRPIEARHSLQLKTFACEGGWGYAIQKEGKTFIRQAYIPVLSGKQAFASSEDAQKIGQLMIHKIKNGIMPPSITRQELDSLISQ